MDIYIFINQILKWNEKNMHWTNTSMHLHDETWKLHKHILNGRWCTSTTTTATMNPESFPAHPTTLIVNIDTFSNKLHRVQLLSYEVLQQLQMLLHVQWSKQYEYLYH